MPAILMPFIVIALEQQDDSEFLQKTKKDMKITCSILSYSWQEKNIARHLFYYFSYK